MLIKVGGYRINLAHVAFIEGSENSLIIECASGGRIQLKNDDAASFLNAWDKWAEFQADAQEVNEFAVAENLKQIRQAQNKSGIVQPVPAMPRLNRGRG